MPSGLVACWKQLLGLLELTLLGLLGHALWSWLKLAWISLKLDFTLSNLYDSFWRETLFCEWPFYFLDRDVILLRNRIMSIHRVGDSCHTWKDFPSFLFFKRRTVEFKQCTTDRKRETELKYEDRVHTENSHIFCYPYFISTRITKLTAN